jgi:hypothetical protein
MKFQKIYMNKIYLLLFFLIIFIFTYVFIIYKNHNILESFTPKIPKLNMLYNSNARRLRRVYEHFSSKSSGHINKFMRKIGIQL